MTTAREPESHAREQAAGTALAPPADPENGRAGTQPAAQKRRTVEPALALDETSKLIIEQLQQDGRRSYSAIARAVGLSEAAVRQRISRLLEDEVVKIVAVTNPLQVGFPRQAMVHVRTASDLVGTADRLAEIPEVDYCVVTSGWWDVIVELVCEDDDHLLQVLTTIRQTEGVRETETLTYLSLRKQEYDWGTR